MNKFLLLFLISCSGINVKAPVEVAKEFSPGEIILANQLLTKIFEKEMAPLACVESEESAGLYLRTLNPRMEMAQDDIEASLDDEVALEKLVSQCQNSCTCYYLDDLLREHQVNLSKKLSAKFNESKKKKSLNTCLNYVSETFCGSEMYKTLDQEKVDFTFD